MAGQFARRHTYPYKKQRHRDDISVSPPRVILTESLSILFQLDLFEPFDRDHEDRGASFAGGQRGKFSAHQFQGRFDAFIEHA